MPRLLRLLLVALLVATPLTLAAGGPVAAAPDDPAVTTESLPAAQVGSQYSFNLEATGGTGDFTFRVSVGELPAGLTLYPHGLIFGTPREAGQRTLLIAVTDTASATGVRYLTLEVAKGPATRVGWLEIWPAQPRIGQTAMVGVSSSVRPVEFYMVDPTGTRTELCSHPDSCTTPTLTVPGRYTFGAALPETADWMAGEGVSRTVEVLRQLALVQAQLDSDRPATHVAGSGAAVGGTLVGVPEDATGTITFRAGVDVLATVHLPAASDRITLDLSRLSPGTHLIHGSYSGDARYEPFNSLPGSVTMIASLAWTTSGELAGATYSLPHAELLQASDPAATFSLAPGAALPAGLSLRGGWIAGIPEQVGTFTFEIVARRGAEEVTREFTLTVAERLLDYTVTSSTPAVAEGEGTLTITVAPPTGTELDWAGLIVPAEFLTEPEPANPPDPVCVMTHPDTSCEVDIADLPAGKYLVTAVPMWLQYGWELPELPPLVDLQVTPHLVLTNADLRLGAGDPGRIGLAAPLPADATGTVTVAVTPLGSGKRVPAPGEVLCSFDVTTADSCELPADLTAGLYPLTVTYDGNYGIVTTTAALTVSVAPTPPTPPIVEPGGPDDSDDPVDPVVDEPVDEADPPASSDPGAAPGAEPATAPGTPTAAAGDGGREQLERTGATPWPMAALALGLCVVGAAVLHRTRQATSRP